MAALTSTTGAGVVGVFTVTELTLGSSDTITYNASYKQLLIVRNPTGGAISPIIDGADGMSVVVDGIGSVSVGSGYAMGSIAAGACKAVVLQTVREFCRGVVTVTGASGGVASLVNL